MNSKKRIYCTYFDKNYLVQGFALIESLKRHDPNSELYVLALDETVAEYVARFQKKSNLIKESDIVDRFPQLEELKKTRKLTEYYFTMTPFLMSYVSELRLVGEIINYVDADIFYFDSPERIYRDFANFDVGIIPHNYNPRNENKLAKYGTYNVGLVTIRNNASGLSTLKWWQDRCEEWCEDKPLDGRYADQGYLNSFPKISSSLKIVLDPGANLAPWNIENYSLSLMGEKVVINDQYSLIFFHFHGLKRYFNYFFSSHLIYKAPFTNLIKNNIYQHYINELYKISNTISYEITKNKLTSQKRSKRLLKIGSITRNLLFFFWSLMMGNFNKVQAQSRSVGTI